MNKITVGIIGAGKIGKLHAQNILQSDKFHLRAIADIRIDHLKGSPFEEKVSYLTTDPMEMIKDKEIDAIFICSLTETHVGFIKAAAKEEKHVFCEKPISLNIEETREVVDVVQETGIKFQIGFNRRFDKHFKKVYEAVHSGKVGKPHIVKITSRDPEPAPESYISRSGGLFIDMTIHDFDMLRYLSGSEVTEVTVKAANLIDSVFEKYKDVDTAVLMLQFQNGSLGVIDNSRRAVYGYDQRIEVFGEKGMVSAENETKTNVQLATKDGISLDQPKYFFMDRYQDAYVTEIDEFANAILQNKPVPCSVEDGYRAELIALAAKTSYEEKKTISISELMERSNV